MGTKVQCKSYLPGYYPMRDLNQDSNSCSWPSYYGDKTLTNGQYYSGFLPRAAAEAYSGYEKNLVRQTMLQHEAVFKKQVFELHRLYQIQRDLMDEVKRKEQHKHRIPVETSYSPSHLTSQITSEDARKWHIPSFPLANSVVARPSISGVEDIHSPLSSMKGSCTQAVPLPFQNGGSSKDVELLESRPTKVRRKMIDLQLPADEYIDTEDGEQFRDETISGSSSYLPNGNHKITSNSGVKLFAGDGEKSGCQQNASRSDSYLRSTNSLADLNEPIPVEETNTSAYFDLLSHASCNGEIKGHELSTKTMPQLQGLPKDFSLNSHHVSNNGTPNNRYIEIENGRSWFSNVIETGPTKSNLMSVSQGLQYEKSSISSQSTQGLLNKAHDPPAFLLTDQTKVDPWRERTIRGFEISERNHSNNNHPESGVASNIPSSYSVASSSDLFNSWPHSVSAWEKPCGSLNQKSMSVQTHPYLNSSGTLSRSPQTAAQTYGIFGDRWNLNSNPRPNSSVEGELSNRNGFYYGSSSGSKDHMVLAPSVSYNHLNYGHENNVASERVINHGSAKFYKGSSSVDMKSAQDGNLNVVLSNSSQEAVPRQSLELKDGGRKNEDYLAVLPWLRAKSSCKHEATVSERDLNVGDLSFLRPSLNQVERSEFLSDRKILGFPLFEKSHTSKNDSSSLTSPSVCIPPPSVVEVENNRKNRVLDINLPCDTAVADLSQEIADDELVIEKKPEAKVASFRHHIDLNSCVSEDEASLMPTVLSTAVKTGGIDLEALIDLETEDDVMHGAENPQKSQEAPLEFLQPKTELLQDELVRGAAEAIVSISSSGPYDHLDDATCNSSEASVKDPLNWFVEIVEIVSSCVDDLESKLDAVWRGRDGENNEESSSEEIDYFESMTLKLTETKEEDYMPKPLVPEDFKVEEAGTTLLPNRTRKGQSRRGRQRRDFQRDILPGLASLSRHEVTEDLQTFGGLMRATGHTWHSGLTRRNSTRSGCARGRRRSVVSPSPVVVASTCTPLMPQLTNIEVGLDDRSLTGWGKTTRRPRRQRCPAGNLPLPMA
ncbi:hypothetical protein Patl1_16743 [Pistacia atlantica]|uniref:Uncharacterized protein n=1 Tax=Pistacia atlantica TaxID=434234 RepID=A0ACC1B9N9_9ROSI|nr:hypothetical protein Patl1_16743 [Pistacia atlantica]